MATSRTVTPADLQDGWICDKCRKPFKVDDLVYGDVSDEYGHDPYGLNSLSSGGTESDYDLSSGHTVSNFRCLDCFVSEISGIR
jgi:hypothetical protein